MIRTTRAQRVAIKRIFDRCPVYPEPRWDGIAMQSQMPINYRQFRRRVQPMYGGQGAVVLPWQKMFLAIEPDGYTHS